MIKNLHNIIYKLFHLINKEDRSFLFIITFFSLVTSLLEILSLTSFYYFLNFFSNQIQKIPQFIINILDIKIISFFNYGIIFFVCFVSFSLLRVFFSIFTTHLTHNFNYKFNVAMSDFLSFSYLTRNYQKIINQNDSSLISNLTDKIPHVGSILLNVNFLFAELLILLATLLFLSLVNWKLTLFLLFFFLFILISFNKILANKINNISKERQYSNNKRLELSSFIIKSLKDIKILQKENYVHSLLRIFTKKNFEAYKKMQLIQSYPRFISEVIFLSLILIFFLYIFYIKQAELNNYIPLIGVYAFSIFRIIPVINKIIFYISNSLFYKPTLEIFYDEKSNFLRDKKRKNLSYKKKEINFTNKLNVNNISFSYKSKNYIFKNLNINFLKNNSYAILGPSGFGKTTLLNILLGLLRPIKGSVQIDDKNILSCLPDYLSLIGYIPQEFYFLEDTVQNTILFGKKKDEKKIKDIIINLKLINSTNKNKINNFLNRNVKLLSVGQKQKVAIARCLYNENKILIFDEPTSSLDSKSINEFIKIITSLKKNRTIIVVTHDINFANNFDHQIDLSQSK
jgi:ABC-type multidrug transport system fused ATPase/permease subunit